MVSIIIPVYNTDKNYIERCIGSIKKQTYCDYEVILVDDGSEMSYSEYLDSYADEEHFFVLHQKNAGVSEARNNGIRHAKGEYITFVDSDDYISEDFIGSAVELIEKYSADLVIGGIVIEDGDKRSICSINSSQEIVYKDTNALRRYFLTAQYENDSKELRGLRCGGPWCKLYKRSVVENQSFRKSIPVYEDMIFNLETLENVDTIVVSPAQWYNYVLYSTSAMRKYRPDGIHEQRMVMDFLRAYKESHPEVSAAIAKKTGECIKKIITATLYHKDSDISDRAAKLRAVFSDDQTKALLNGLDPALYPGLPRSERLFYTLCAKRKPGVLNMMFSAKKILKKN